MSNPLGNLPRFDYTHNKAQALASEESATIFFTTDNFIVFNGEVWTKNSPVHVSGMVNGSNQPINYRQSDGSIELPAYSAGTQVKGDAETNYRTGQVNITKANIGLGNVGNFKAVSTEAVQGLSETEKENARANIGLEKGVANGVATLDSNGKVPSTQLPSYVDDVIEGYKFDGRFYTSAQHETEITGETGKVYVDVESGNNTTWRWSGSAFVQIKGDLVLGEGQANAYRGDRGKIAYDHAQAKGSAFASGLYKITVNSEGHVTAAVAVAKSDITALGIPSENTDTSVTSETNHYLPSPDSLAILDPTLVQGDADAQNYVVQKIKRDSRGHVTGIVSKKVITDVSGKADKSEMSVTPGTGADADKTTIQLKSGTSATVLTSHQNISGKEDSSNKVTSIRAVASATDTAYPTEKAVATALKAIQDQLDLLKWK